MLPWTPNKRYEGYMVKDFSTTVTLNKVKKVLKIPADTLVVLDPETHLAYYQAFEVQLKKQDYQLIS